MACCCSPIEGGVAPCPTVVSTVLGTSNGTPITVNYDASLAVGDLMVIVACTSNFQNFQISQEIAADDNWSIWSALPATGDAGNLAVGLFAKHAEAGDIGGSVDIFYGGSTRASSQVWANLRGFYPPMLPRPDGLVTNDVVSPYVSGPYNPGRRALAIHYCALAAFDDLVMPARLTSLLNNKVNDTFPVAFAVGTECVEGNAPTASFTSGTDTDSIVGTIVVPGNIL
ncbi:MAG: hypothetical protein K0U78_16320 [Actinomycetia bacterium]|nr:hypothetical protein [Actinomycetes bacterium]